MQGEVGGYVLCGEEGVEEGRKLASTDTLVFFHIQPHAY